MKKHFLIVGILFLLVLSSVPVTFGYNVKISDDESMVEDYNFNRHLFPEYYDSYSVDEIPENVRPYVFNNNEIVKDLSNSEVINYEETFEPINGPMDSPWPMYCHDARHTGRSPYITADNPGTEKWRFETNNWVGGGPVIDEDGIIYVGSDRLYAIYPNGTLKWKTETRFRIISTPAIDENGILYIGNYWAGPNYLYAIYTNNGTEKWKYSVGDWIASSPAIGDDGSIYFGSQDDYIYALYPNGTLKWKYLTSVAVYSSPAIGDDGTIYCGSHDTYLYALYPNNGTMKWKYGTGHWIRTSPCIADDGTIYVVSLDSYLHAIYPNSTLKWKTNVGAGTSPTIAQDGTIYAGYAKLYAINPTNGSVKWTFDPGPDRQIRGATPCNSADGTIYFGTHIGDYYGGELIAVNPDGTEKWRITIANDWVDSAPAIGEDGTIYVGSEWEPPYYGFFHAIGKLDPEAPSAPDINGPSSGKPGTSYTYTFTSIDPDGDQVSYYIDWGDGNITDWTSFQPSGEPYTESHTWTTKGTYIVRAKAKDTDGYESDWGELQVTIPRDKATNEMLLLRLLERFPLLQKLLLLIN